MSFFVTDSQIIASINNKQIVVRKTQEALDAIAKYLKEVETGQNTYTLGEILLQQLTPIFKAISLAEGQLKYNEETGEMWVTDLPNEPLPKLLKDRLLEFIDSNFPVKALINFWRKLVRNPDKHVRTNLYKFLEHTGHPIDENGNFIAYKSVKRLKAKTANQDVFNRLTLAGIESGLDFIERNGIDENTKIGLMVDYKWATLSSPAVSESQVEPVTKKQLRNALNKDYYTDLHSQTMVITKYQEVELDRKKCDNNPNNTCSAGLHVGNMDYVNDFGRGETDRVILACNINPEDVVSIPNDYNCMKMRCCKYTPLYEVTERELDNFIAMKEKLLTMQTEVNNSYDEEDKYDENEGYDDEDHNETD